FVSDEAFGELCRLGRPVLHDRVDKRTEAALACDLRTGPPLRLIGKIEIFNLRLGRRREDALLKLVRQLALLADRVQNRLTPLVELTQIGQSLRQIAELRIIEPAGDLLAVSRNEWNRGALIKKTDGCQNLICTGADFLADNRRMALQKV